MLASTQSTLIVAMDGYSLEAGVVNNAGNNGSGSRRVIDGNHSIIGHKTIHSG